ncbi:hypothetical protein BIFGAL_02920 [Bifidobacterium gallicum DSM 20093 = LMG 11596]|uniref:Uncharacterized protein n=1 Tax=Bifidobacterium gallicum DSM 20093 = LMG 11596 TaxID=561180 RepID=D1NT10_9BIFI|nr:hypothetical protein BIFGAL_02920 [Bifidobacterium gallicum DSM 20093 = LMG 11596]
MLACGEWWLAERAMIPLFFRYQCFASASCAGGCCAVMVLHQNST